MNGEAKRECCTGELFVVCTGIVGVKLRGDPSGESEIGELKSSSSLSDSESDGTSVYEYVELMSRVALTNATNPHLGYK